MLSTAQFLFGIAFLVLARCAHSEVTVRVEFHPSSTSPIPKCSPSFVNKFHSNLNSFILDATHKHEALADFTFTQEMHLTHSHNRRFLRFLKPPGASQCSTCSSGKCGLSCGYGDCGNLCGTSRLLQNSAPMEGEIEETKSDERKLALTWDELGVDVTLFVTPLVKNLLLEDTTGSFGCMGNPETLGVNVTFLKGHQS